MSVVGGGKMLPRKQGAVPALRSWDEKGEGGGGK